ncbi:MAG: phosphoribosylaminoimidazolesuccinocarboxamide synthase [Candidatus Nitrosopumilus limneticus]|nr:Phosphoribosylaminoimidazole-succinocarboxamide synthase [Candidatus Nitrosopumilus limneticus]MDC4212416.1 phosphoribosylaminoimidazolesuccinocarboxamide synthase [Candidatus Nitrosopumilus limneticus]MDC4213248.1 phosphoribosylaminoimidazolesuccinocarboxamide synthase [Candidatus Nitrosopumilus limneticus]MDC4215693.1 phosphoribosylaminoimidazolesuccinocarboxamide synthase [Candidatus Nitrosopumilus limneticus]MDC4217169.1 phosphoribosylaminoimidazolesuccinocarboxamide synthase [Candidatus
MKFLASGKVKDLYDVDEKTLQFKFSNRVSAYDVKFNQDIPKKGDVLCRFAEFWFNKLNVKNHFIQRISDTEISVKKMKMIPMECVVRGYFYGSLIGRWKNGSIKLPENTNTSMAAKLTKPIFDPTTKSEHDVPVDKKQALQMNLVSEEQYNWLEKTSIDIYNQMTTIADNVGYILADLKLEFGILDGEIILGDSIGPDEYRLWSKDNYEVGKIQESYDKQILRDWLTANGYEKQFENDRHCGKEPIAPQIPPEIIQTMTQRYVVAYEKLSGQTL